MLGLTDEGLTVGWRVGLVVGAKDEGREVGSELDGRRLGDMLGTDGPKDGRSDVGLVDG